MDAAPQPHAITDALTALRGGEPDAMARLVPLVYQELARIARRQLRREAAGHTLSTTALVHEAYLRLVAHAEPGWNGRGHFFGAAAQAMREIIVDHVRRKAAAKRGGGQKGAPLDAAISVAGDVLGVDEVLSINAAIARLEVEHPRKAQVVVMRYFGGLSEEEMAEALGVTTRTIEREWRFARAYLHDVLSREGR